MEKNKIENILKLAKKNKLFETTTSEIYKINFDNKKYYLKKMKSCDETVNLPLKFFEIANKYELVEKINFNAKTMVGFLNDKEVVVLDKPNTFFQIEEEVKGQLYWDILEKAVKNNTVSKEDLNYIDLILEHLTQKKQVKEEKADMIYLQYLNNIMRQLFYEAYNIDRVTEKKMNKEIFEIVLNCVHKWHYIADLKDRLKLIHGDFHPMNIFISDNKIRTIDSLGFGTGEIADDLGTFTGFLIYFMVTNENNEAIYKIFDYLFENYYKQTQDKEMPKIIQFFIGYRLFGVANPLFSPDVCKKDVIKLMKISNKISGLEKFDYKKIKEYLKVD